MASLTRRAFLALTALAAPFSRLGLGAQATPSAISIDEFVRLSQRLVGRPALDRELAATYLNALLAVPRNSAPLARLARTTPETAVTPEHAALERTIIEWWYTGTYTLKGEPHLATYTGALMWNAIGVPAAGTCRDTFGAWSRPPQRRA